MKTFGKGITTIKKTAEDLNDKFEENCEIECTTIECSVKTTTQKELDHYEVKEEAKNKLVENNEEESHEDNLCRESGEALPEVSPYHFKTSEGKETPVVETFDS